MSELLLRRRVAMAKSLPYDAEIEYLEVDGYEYIDTNITPNETVEHEVKWMPTNTYTSSTGLVSARNNASGSVKSGYSLSLWVNGTNVAMNDNNWSAGSWSNVLTNNTASVIAIKERNLYVDNTLIVTSASTNQFSFDCTYGLLRGRILNNWDSRRGSTGKIYYAKIWKDNSLVRDFIPVRVGQVGYMYDKVSRRLFGNAGTGDFVLGPDL